MVALCRGLPGRRTKHISPKTCKSAFTAEFKALFLPMITQQCAYFCFRKNYYICQNSGHPSGGVQLPILCLFHPSSHNRVHRDGNHGLHALHLEGTCGSWYDAPEMLKSLAECLPLQWLNKERGFFKSICRLLDHVLKMTSLLKHEQLYVKSVMLLYIKSVMLLHGKKNAYMP